MTKELHREVMKRLRFHNNFLRSKSQEDRLKYNKQQNFCKNYWEQLKNIHFSNLDIKKVVDNRNSWEIVSPLSSTKGSKGDKIILNENDQCVSNDHELCQFSVAISPILFLIFKFQVYLT